MATSPVSNYDRVEVVDTYRRSLQLFDCEKYLFDKYIEPGSRILDLGVGAGRTTPFLAPSAKAYVGFDYAPHMVAACRDRFPQYRFEVGDAADLSRFEDNSFDVVVFALSGIDYLRSDAARRSCLQHCSRVLRSGGRMILSVHNVRRVICRPLFAQAPVWKKIWRTCRAPFYSLVLMWRVGLTCAFLRGHGFIWDPADGGTVLHVATKEFTCAELSEFGLQVVEIVPHDYPLRTGTLTTPWFYYVAQKR